MPTPLPTTDPIHDVLVFRALMLGDLLCATPALRALRAGLPDARISLVGLPWARELAERLPSVDEFVEFPGWPGLPERTPAEAAQRQQFIAGLRERQFGLALQLHGSGAIVNALVSSFGARHTAGFNHAEGWTPAADAALFTDWPETGTEVERLLALTDHLGLPRRGLALDFPLQDTDRDAAAALCRGLGDRPLAIVHAGAQLPSRRWPLERFGEIADALAEAGLAVVLTGGADERELVDELARQLQAPALNLVGSTSLWTLGALVERARVVVCNDTGISHVAAALGTRSVVVASGGDVARWAPADTRRHAVLWHDVPCRPCAHAQCPIGHPCALGVAVADVRAAALRAADVAPPSTGITLAGLPVSMVA